MMVLSRLEGLRLRGLYFTETQRLTLSGVGLEEASDAGSGRRAQNVEMCACPPDYTGDSCQVGILLDLKVPPGDSRGWFSWLLCSTLSVRCGCAVASILPGPPSAIKYEKEITRVSKSIGKHKGSVDAGGCSSGDFVGGKAEGAHHGHFKIKLRFPRG